MVNTTAAIMALPAPLDPIRLVGDEDKHATLLFLGETSTLPDDAKQVLTDSVQQASSMLFPFSERIRDVTRLGAELPPALVVTLSDMNLSQIRNLFMMNPSIKSYLDNTQQFPSFTPHVTLGHPDFTDEVILRALAKNLFRAQFDRLAVWFNDEKIEFPLVRDNQENIAMSYAIGEFLEHVSTKPWGDYTAADYTPEQYKAACLVVRGDGSTKAQCKLPVKTPDGALSKPGVAAAAAALAGARGGVDLTDEERASAKKKLQGYYKQLNEDPPPSLAHAIIALEKATTDDVQQHGIKGMKWGVRRSRDASTGLVKRTSSADQIRQDQITKKLTSGGSHSLSNKDIEDFTRRLRLEQDLNKALASIPAPDRSRASTFITNFVKSQGNRQFNRVADRAVDIAVEQGINAAARKVASTGTKLGSSGKSGVMLSKQNQHLAKNLEDLSSRLKPKKKK